MTRMHTQLDEDKLKHTIMKQRH